VSERTRRSRRWRARRNGSMAVRLRVCRTAKFVRRRQRIPRYRDH